MKNFFRIILIFLYFSLCFIFKGNIEAHFANDCTIAQKTSNNVIEQVNFQDNSALVQNNSQEITNIQNNSRNYKPVFDLKKHFLFPKINYLKSKNAVLFSNVYLAYSFKHIINTRAP